MTREVRTAASLRELRPHGAGAAMPMTAAGDVAVVSLRSAPGGAELTQAEREAMLADVRGNPASTARLTLVANTYIQGAAPGERPNGKFVRIRDGGMRAAARSYRGAPFLRDHQTGDLAARGGTILDSELVALEDGSKAFRQTIELTKPWAIEAVLDGTGDRFSTSFELVGAATCTVCNEPAVMGWFSMYLDCEHCPGMSYELDKGGSRVAEIEYENASGLESSLVSLPAVQGTGIDEVRASLAAGGDRALAELAEDLGIEAADLARELRLPRAASAPAPASAALLASLSAVLALPAGAGEPEALAAVKGLHAELAASLAREKKAQVDAVVEHGLSTGRLIPGTELESEVRSMAEKSVEAARSFLAGIRRNMFTPVGAPMQSGGADPTPSSMAMLSEEQKKVNRLIGAKDETVARELARKDR